MKTYISFEDLKRPAKLPDKFNVITDEAFGYVARHGAYWGWQGWDTKTRRAVYEKNMPGIAKTVFYALAE